MQDLGLTDQDILHLAESGTIKNSNLTEAEITANIMRDPILIGVTRFICIFDIFFLTAIERSYRGPTSGKCENRHMDLSRTKLFVTDTS